MLGVAAEAIADYTRWKSRAEAGRAHHNEITASCRSGLAQLLGAKLDEIALLGSSSEAINAVAGVIDFQPGDNVVINDLEFPSVALPWLRLRERGVEVQGGSARKLADPGRVTLGRYRQPDTSVGVEPGELCQRLAPRYRGDLCRIARYTNPVSARRNSGAGCIAGRCNTRRFRRWQHLQVAARDTWSRGDVNRDQIATREPASIGWYSLDTAFTEDRYERYRLRSDAGRFETGYLNFPAIYALNTSVTYLLDVGIDRIAIHALSLGDTLIAGLQATGLTVTSPIDRERRGGSVTFLHERAAELGGRLAERNIHVWAGDGRVRASTHAFNDSDDVERYLEAVRAELGA